MPSRVAPNPTTSGIWPQPPNVPAFTSLARATVAPRRRARAGGSRSRRTMAGPGRRVATVEDAAITATPVGVELLEVVDAGRSQADAQLSRPGACQLLGVKPDAHAQPLRRAKDGAVSSRPRSQTRHRTRQGPAQRRAAASLPPRRGHGPPRIRPRADRVRARKSAHDAQREIAGSLANRRDSRSSSSVVSPSPDLHSTVVVPAPSCTKPLAAASTSASGPRASRPPCAGCRGRCTARRPRAAASSARSPAKSGWVLAFTRPG